MNELYTGAGYQDGSAQPEGAEKQPDTAEKQPDTAEKQPDEKKGDPLTALVQERAANRDRDTALRGELDSLKAELATLRQPAPATEPAEWKNPHDPVEQPMDHLRAELEHVKADLAGARQTVGADLDQQKQIQALNEYEQGLTMELQGAASSHPVLAEAHAHLTQVYTSIARAQGAQGAEVAQRARLAMLQGYLNAAQQGKDAVTATAEMAMATGFQSKGGTMEKPKQETRGQKAAEQSIGGATGGSGVTPAPDMASLGRMTRKELMANDKAGVSRIKQILAGEV